jgi:hypothetical protein
MSVNTFSAIRTIALEADTTDKVVTAIAELAGPWVFNSQDYEAQLECLGIIRDLAHERLGADDIDWDADGALNAIYNLAKATLREDS